ncbi:MAG: T9SS type A sorting domain-containing protein [Bacteroidia bacterium]
MKKIFYISLLLLLFSSRLLSQAPAIQWQHAYGGSADDYFVSGKNTSDGGYIVAGYTSSADSDVTFNHGAHDCWVAKLDNSGTIQWQNSYGGSDDEQPTVILCTPDNGYIFAGQSKSNDGDIHTHHGMADSSDCWVVKLDSTGHIMWETSLGGTGWDVATGISKTLDGGYVVIGTTESFNEDVTFNHGGSDVWIIKLSSSGTIQWQKTYGGTSFESGMSIVQMTDSTYTALANTYSADGDVTLNKGQTDYWVIHISKSGSIIWQKTYGGTQADEPFNIEKTTDGGYILGGYSSSQDGDVSINYAASEYWIVKLDSTGTMEWEKTYGGQGGEINGFVSQTSDGGYMVAGGSSSYDGDATSNHGIDDFWILRLTATGSIIWQHSYGGPWYDAASEMLQTSDGGYFLIGRSMFTGGDLTQCNGGYDGWLVKLEPETGINEISAGNSVSVFPNPFSDNTKVSFSNPDHTESLLLVYDSMGKLVNKRKTSTNEFNIERSELNAGIYFFRIMKEGAPAGSGKLVVN